jgi:hypothetical protein
MSRVTAVLLILLLVISGCGKSLDTKWREGSRFDEAQRLPVYLGTEIELGGTSTDKDGNLLIATNVTPLCREMIIGTQVETATRETTHAAPAGWALNTLGWLLAMGGAIGGILWLTHDDYYEEEEEPWKRVKGEEPEATPKKLGGQLFLGLTSSAVALLITGSSLYYTAPQRSETPDHPALNKDGLSFPRNSWFGLVDPCTQMASLPPHDDLPEARAIISFVSRRTKDAVSVELPVEWQDNMSLKIPSAAWRGAQSWLRECHSIEQGSLTLAIEIQEELHPLRLSLAPTTVEELDMLENRAYWSMGTQKSVELKAGIGGSLDERGSGSYVRMADLGTDTFSEKSRVCIMEARDLCLAGNYRSCDQALQHAEGNEERRRLLFAAGQALCNANDPAGCDQAAENVKTAREKPIFVEKARLLRYMASSALCKEGNPDGCDLASHFVLGKTEKERYLIRSRALRIDLCEGNPEADRPADPISCDVLVRTSQDPIESARFEIMARRARETSVAKWNRTLGGKLSTAQQLVRDAERAKERHARKKAELEAAKKEAKRLGVDERQMQAELRKLEEAGDKMRSSQAEADAWMRAAEQAPDIARQVSGTSMGAAESAAVQGAGQVLGIIGDIQRQRAQAEAEAQRRAEEEARRKLELAREHARIIRGLTVEVEQAREEAENALRAAEIAVREIDMLKSQCEQEVHDPKICEQALSKSTASSSLGSTSTSPSSGMTSQGNLRFTCDAGNICVEYIPTNMSSLEYLRTGCLHRKSMGHTCRKDGTLQCMHVGEHGIATTYSRHVNRDFHDSQCRSTGGTLR